MPELPGKPVAAATPETITAPLAVETPATALPVEPSATPFVPSVTPPPIPETQGGDLAGAFLKGRQDQELMRLLDGASANIRANAPRPAATAETSGDGVPSGPWPNIPLPPQQGRFFQAERPFTPDAPVEGIDFRWGDLIGGGPAMVGLRNVAPDAASFMSDVLAPDMRRGIIEGPKMVLGGARDAVQNTLFALDDLAGWMFKNSGLMDAENAVRDALGVQTVTGDERVVPTLPEVGKAKSTTGQLVRGVSQFLSGFVAVRR